VAIKPNLLYWFWVAPGFLAGTLEKRTKYQHDNKQRRGLHLPGSFLVPIKFTFILI
jgi:hypothetical protein